MTQEEQEHYQQVIENILFEKAAPGTLGVLLLDEDRAGCVLMAEHIDYKKSPALIHLRWDR